MLAAYLTKIANEFIFERAKPFKGNALATFIRDDLAIEAKKNLVFGLHDQLSVRSSPGSGNWAGVPWLAYFDPLITDSAQRGFYVVFLINAQDHSIVLSLNQGATDVYREFGASKGREVLRRRALDIRDRISEFAQNFETDPIELGSNDDLPSGYVAGHAFGRTYRENELTEALLTRDLELMLNAYKELIDRGGVTPLDVMQDDAQSTDIEEVRRYTLSKRIERSPHVRKAVLNSRPRICQSCGLEPELDYRYFGKLDNTPLDVHHSAPLRSLMEGERRRYKVPDDFMILCPTCHRMIHKQEDPSDLLLLKSNLRFKLMREIG